MKKNTFKSKKSIILSAIMATISAIVLIIAAKNAVFANFVNEKICHIFRYIFSKTTNILPFSLAELLVFMFPIIITVIIISSIKNKNVSVSVYLIKTLSIGLAVFSLFVFTIGTSYHTESFYQRFDIDVNMVTADELNKTAKAIATNLNELSEHVEYRNDGFSIMPYDLSELNKKLNTSFRHLSEKHSFLSNLNVGAKPVLMSEVLSYAHVTGFYSFFTGEANLNVNFPPYTLPFTAAHELAHQRGIAREGEANFIAFLACINSDDIYINYSANLNMLEYILSDLSEVNKNSFFDVYNSLNEKIRNEMKAYSLFYEKYKNSALGGLGTSINDAYLIANGEPEGTKSYAQVVNLAVAYFQGKIN